MHRSGGCCRRGGSGGAPQHVMLRTGRQSAFHHGVGATGRVRLHRQDITEHQEGEGRSQHERSQASQAAASVPGCYGGRRRRGRCCRAAVRHGQRPDGWPRPDEGRPAQPAPGRPRRPVHLLPQLLVLVAHHPVRERRDHRRAAAPAVARRGRRRARWQLQPRRHQLQRGHRHRHLQPVHAPTPRHHRAGVDHGAVPARDRPRHHRRQPGQHDGHQRRLPSSRTP